ncbi:uncharacterized protein LOC125043098 [Penaeus chinensis]|uniref:uncharacterized protein LOC125043098 n=1 Tax=Penaeus chinensis TaxID=139456 RepID=UPI001FB6225E|nr:uncharacterized protein LOC125043098 [Penaeus chinensis]
MCPHIRRVGISTLAGSTRGAALGGPQTQHMWPSLPNTVAPPVPTGSASHPRGTQAAVPPPWRRDNARRPPPWGPPPLPTHLPGPGRPRGAARRLRGFSIRLWGSRGRLTPPSALGPSDQGPVTDRQEQHGQAAGAHRPWRRSEALDGGADDTAIPRGRFRVLTDAPPRRGAPRTEAALRTIFREYAPAASQPFPVVRAAMMRGLGSRVPSPPTRMPCGSWRFPTRTPRMHRRHYAPAPSNCSAHADRLLSIPALPPADPSLRAKFTLPPNPYPYPPALVISGIQ